MKRCTLTLEWKDGRRAACVLMNGYPTDYRLWRGQEGSGARSWRLLLVTPGKYTTFLRDSTRRAELLGWLRKRLVAGEKMRVQREKAAITDDES